MNSLFEDNAEFGLGMALGQKAIRNRLVGYVTEIKDTTDNADLKAACEGYLDTITDSTSSRPATDALIAELEKAVDDAKVGELAKKTLVDKDELAKKSMWIFGGDGWAYDIGRRERKHSRIRHRGLLQHRRPVLQGYSYRLRCTVRSCR